MPEFCNFILIVMFFSPLAILSHFLPSPFLAPRIAFWAVWENKNCSIQTDILQRLHADSESWNSLLWILIDYVKNKTGLMVVIHICYILNCTIKTKGWGEKMYFPNLSYLQRGGQRCACVCSFNSWWKEVAGSDIDDDTASLLKGEFSPMKCMNNKCKVNIIICMCHFCIFC